VPPDFGPPPSKPNRNGHLCDVNYNIYFDPLFVDAANYDFHLQSGSKCINAGTPFILDDNIMDPDGTYPEIGAYHFRTVVKMVIPDTSAAPGNTVHIPIKISDAVGVAGAEIKVTCDPTILNPVGVSTTTLTKDFTLNDSIMTGKIAISIANSTGLTGGNGDFVDIKFKVNENANVGATSPLHF
jgi:hypothetical protein